MRKFLYHANCADGFCAAFIDWRNRSDNTVYIPVQYDEEPPVLNPEDDIIIADFSYKRPVLEKIKEKVNSLVVLDHHQTAQEELRGLDYCIFDMTRSGARLVQQFFNYPDHWLIDYTEDRDLWRWELPDSKEINAGISALPFDFTWWESSDRYHLKRDGELVLRIQEKQIDSLEKKAFDVLILEFPCKIVNCTDSTIISDLAKRLIGMNQMGGTFFVNEQGATFSLRSEGDFNVADIARLFGGGGHKNAAGFSINFVGFYSFMKHKVLFA